jgi:hypothetical protein
VYVHVSLDLPYRASSSLMRSFSWPPEILCAKCIYKLGLVFVRGCDDYARSAIKRRCYLSRSKVKRDLHMRASNYLASPWRLPDTLCEARRTLTTGNRFFAVFCSFTLPSVLFRGTQQRPPLPSVFQNTLVKRPYTVNFENALGKEKTLGKDNFSTRQRHATCVLSPSIRRQP